MKRLLAAILSTAAAAGCSSSKDGGSTDDKPTGNVVFMRHDNPSYLTGDKTALADAVAKLPGVTVDMPTTLTYPTLGATLLSDLKTDKLAADLVRIPPSWLCTFAANLADVPESVVSLSEAQNTIFGAPLQGATCNGKLKGIPVEYNLEYGGVVVNVDAYQAKFNKMPNWPTWDSFIQDASDLAQFDNGTPKANGLDIAPDWTQPVKHIFFSQILQRGGKYWATEGKSFSLTSKEATDSLTAMVGWIKDKKVMTQALIPDSNTFVTTRLALGASGFGWGDVAKPLSLMGYCGTWGVPNTVSQLPTGSVTKYDYYTVPPMVGTLHKFVQNSGWALGVPKNAKNPTAAWALVKAMALDPTIMKHWGAVTGSLPALRANGTVAASADDPLLAKVQPLLDQGQWVGYIPATAIDTVEGTIVSNFFAAVACATEPSKCGTTGYKTITAALADMEAAANAALAAAQ